MCDEFLPRGRYIESSQQVHVNALSQRGILLGSQGWYVTGMGPNPAPVYIMLPPAAAQPGLEPRTPCLCLDRLFLLSRASREGLIWKRDFLWVSSCLTPPLPTKRSCHIYQLTREERDYKKRGRNFLYKKIIKKMLKKVIKVNRCCCC